VIKALDFASDWGTLGIAVLLLVLAIRMMYRHSREDRIAHDRENVALLAAKDAQLVELNNKLAAEQALRVDDAKRFTEVALKLQSAVISSVASIEKASGENAKLCGFVEKLVSTVQSLLEEQQRGPPARRR
jgi:hypothetical protein